MKKKKGKLGANKMEMRWGNRRVRWVLDLDLGERFYRKSN